MNSQIGVPVSTETFLELVDFLRDNNDPRDPVLMVTTAIDYWLSNASDKPELLSQTDARGYQWKSLFLQDQTQIRMPYKGAYFYAKVEGDKMIYNGQPITPARLANAITNSSRNAWRDLWIKRPQDSEWKLADECRDETRETAAKLLE